MSRGRRALLALATFGAVAIVAFFVVELAPGDAASARLGLHGDDAARQALREALGLSGGLVERLGRWLAHLARLDLGRSLLDGRPVAAKIAERLPLTAALAAAALALAWAIALPLALVRARRARAGLTLALGALYAVPVPALGLALLALGGGYGPSAGALLAAAASLQPLLVPTVYAHLARAIDEALHGDALRTLRAAGAAPGRLRRAALRGQALRLLTLAALQLPALLSGAALVEAIFGLPGIGLLAFDALAGRDHPVQLGLVLTGAALAIGCNLAVDLVAPLLDPRLQARAGGR